MNSIKDLFVRLNEKCVYLILRNWDNILDDRVYESDHSDIDILCEDLASFISLTGAKRIHQQKNRNNYLVSIGNNYIRFDVRWPGDGYYPEAWEREMLLSRVLNEMGVYVMSDIDYVYSLSYHALLQKEQISTEYYSKIVSSFNRVLNITQPISAEIIEQQLKSFMLENDYKAEIPIDCGVYLNKPVYFRLPHNCNYQRFISRQFFSLRRYVTHGFNKVVKVFNKK